MRGLVRGWCGRELLILNRTNRIQCVGCPLILLRGKRKNADWRNKCLVTFVSLQSEKEFSNAKQKRFEANNKEMKGGGME